MIGVSDALFIELLEHQQSTFHQRLLTKDGAVDLHSRFVNVETYTYIKILSTTMGLCNLLLSRSIFVSQSIDVIYYFQSFCLTTTQSPLSEYSLQSNPSKRTENFCQVTALVVFVTYVIKNIYKKPFHLRHQLPIQLGCHQIKLTLLCRPYQQL